MTRQRADNVHGFVMRPVEIQRNTETHGASDNTPGTAIWLDARQSGLRGDLMRKKSDPGMVPWCMT